jgi:imidazolonepropionase-like amidohydrolase
MLVYFRAKQLIDGTGKLPLQDAAVLVEDGIIIECGPVGGLPAPQDAFQVDLGERSILPGLIDAHVHLIGNPQPGGFVATQTESNERLLLRATANARQALSAGLTTVRDCGGRSSIIPSLAEATQSGLVPGPRIVTCGAPITTTGGHCYFLGCEADGIESVQKAVRSMHKMEADFIKVMVTGGGITRGSNSHASQYSQEELNAIVEDAHRLGHRVSGHVHGTEGIRRAVAAGFDTLEHASWLARNGSNRDYDPQVVEQILRKEIIVCRTIAGFERIPIEEATPEHKFWPDYEMLRNMVRDGVVLVAGSDSGIDQTPFSGYSLTLETMAGLGGMNNAEVIRSATGLAAQAIGLGDRIGTIERRKKADFIAVSGNPFEDLRVFRKIDYVIQDGQIVARDGLVIQ